MSDRLMLDPSMVLSSESMGVLLEEAHQGRLSGIVLPGTYMKTRHRLFGFADRRTRSVPDRVVESFFSIAEGQIEPYFATDDLSWEMREALEALGLDEPVAQIVLEEWEFLARNSRIWSKLRDSFDKMIQAGGMALETSRGTYDRIIRRTLQLDGASELGSRERLKGTAKWLAASGPPIWALFEPVSGTIGTVLGNGFLLSDPQREEGHVTWD